MNVDAGTDADLLVVPRPVQRVVAWPGRAHMARTLRLAVQGSVVFAIVYGGADLIARFHTHRISWYLPVDERIPFVPAATLLYSSLWLMFATLPFVLRREHDVRWLTRVIQIEIVIAGVFFLAAPMPARPLPADLGMFAGAFRAADIVNLEFNHFPSLHAAFGFTLAWALAEYGGTGWRLMLIAWSLAIGAAAVLTWQHAVLDVVAGAALAAGVFTLVPTKDRAREQRSR
jgi:membrane-associated phospholipid phosphatase